MVNQGKSRNLASRRAPALNFLFPRAIGRIRVTPPASRSRCKAVDALVLGVCRLSSQDGDKGAALVGYGATCEAKQRPRDRKLTSVPSSPIFSRRLSARFPGSRVREILPPDRRVSRSVKFSRGAPSA